MIRGVRRGVVGLCALVCVVACDLTSRQEFPSEPSLVELGPRCGDGICDVDEWRSSCAMDCVSRLAVDLDSLRACTEAMTPAEIGRALEPTLTLAEAVANLGAAAERAEGLRHTLEGAPQLLYGNVAWSVLDVPTPFDPATATYSLGRLGGLVVTGKLTFGADLVAAAKGAPIAVDVLARSSYLRGVTALERTELGALLSFESVGPLVELLGFGTAPASPLVVGYGATLAKGSVRIAFDVVGGARSREVDWRFRATAHEPEDCCEPWSFTLAEASAVDHEIGTDVHLAADALREECFSGGCPFRIVSSRGPLPHAAEFQFTRSSTSTKKVRVHCL